MIWKVISRFSLGFLLKVEAYLFSRLIVPFRGIVAKLACPVLAYFLEVLEEAPPFAWLDLDYSWCCYSWIYRHLRDPESSAFPWGSVLVFLAERFRSGFLPSEIVQKLVAFFTSDWIPSSITRPSASNDRCASSWSSGDHSSISSASPGHS